MKRRSALKLLGTLLVCLGGRAVMADESIIYDDNTSSGDFLSKYQKPTISDYIFYEEGMGNIIIKRKDGTKIEVPFSDICDALEF